MRILFILLVFASVSYSQEFEKWDKKDISYSGAFENKSAEQDGFLTAVKDVYRFLISDVDGDNCPFTPTCSSFFTEAASDYGLITGGLMFADRFTRDMNLLKGNKYPRSSGGRFADPPQLYSPDYESVRNALRNFQAHE